MGKRLRLAVVVFVACGLVATTAAAADSLQAFRQFVAEQIRATYPGVRIGLVANDGLSVAFPGGDARDISVARAYQFYLDNPRARDALVRDFVRGVAPIQVTAERLVVLVRSESSLQGPERIKTLLSRRLADGLFAIVAMDGPASYEYVTAERLRAQLGLDTAAIWSRAMTNTKAQIREKPRALRPGHVTELSSGNGLASSLLADDAFWDSAELTSGGPVVVAPLARDELLLALQSDAQLVENLRRMMRMTAGDPNNLAEGLLVRRNGHWERLP